jgi:4'-phosphopantetheinyl transferase
MVTELEHDGRIELWLVSLAGIDAAIRREYELLLAPAELTRAQRFLLPAPRDRYLTGRALLRTRLSLYTNVPEQNWLFAENAHGRPYVVEPTEYRHVRFNLSHTNGLVACAFSAKHEIGVDIEETTRDRDFRGLASSYFAPREAADVRGRPAESQRAAFYSYWTLKEAYIKGRGMGLAIPLDSFWFDLKVDPPALRCTDRCADDPTQWQFRQMLPTDRHQLAVGLRAAPGVPLDIRVRWADDGPFAQSRAAAKAPGVISRS